jgi:DNA-binding transcriptional regulator GbsR (MarR family)
MTDSQFQESEKHDATEEIIHRIDSKLRQINERTEKEEKRYMMLSSLSKVVPRISNGEDSSDIKMRIENEKKYINECLDILTGYQKLLMQQLIKLKESTYIKLIVTEDYFVSGHLQLKIGDIVYIIKELDDNLCFGEVISTGSKGKFPRSVTGNL